MMRGFKYYGAPMTQNECYSNLIAPGSTRKGGRFGPCPLFNGTSKLPAVQSNGVFPDDPDAVDMVNVDEFYDKSAADFVREAHGRGQPFFWYACGPNPLEQLIYHQCPLVMAGTSPVTIHMPHSLPRARRPTTPAVKMGWPAIVAHHAACSVTL